MIFGYSIWSIMSIAFRLFGFAQAAEGLWVKHEELQKRKYVADVPVTKKEWTDAADKGDL